MPKTSKRFLDEMPRYLTNKDPSNRLDIAVAINIIHQISGVVVTKQTVEQLKTVGVTDDMVLASKAKVVTGKGKTGISMIGSFIQSGTNYPWRIKMVSCGQCKALLTVSDEHNLEVEEYLCCFCAADRALSDYFEKREKRKKSKRVKSEA